MALRSCARTYGLFACLAALPGTLVGCSSVLGITDFSAADADAGSDVSPAEEEDAEAAPDAGPDAAGAGGNEMLDAAADSARAADSASAEDAARAPEADAAEQDASAPAPTCAVGATRCARNAVETCGPGGAWREPLACGAGQSCSNGACANLPSCASSGPGLSDCGPGRESCCTSIELPAGSYHRTFTSSATGMATALGAPATLSEFRLDKYLVTVARFRKFVSAWSGGSGFTPAPGSGKHTHLREGMGLTLMGGGQEPGWRATDGASVAPTSANLECFARDQTWTEVAGAKESLPMNCMTWAEAYAFCIWDGGFLPSEAEWEYAAAGGSEQRKYPWGNTEPGTSNQYAIYKCLYPSGPAVLGAGICNGTNLAPVGSVPLGAGRWGHLDLAGELWEWTLDSYPGPILPAGYSELCSDCVYQSTAPDRLVRGGQFANPESSLETTFRDNGPAGGRFPGVGIRCARVP
jgi:formylglycine-generating enzyme